MPIILYTLTCCETVRLWFFLSPPPPLGPFSHTSMDFHYFVGLNYIININKEYFFIESLMIVISIITHETNCCWNAFVLIWLFLKIIFKNNFFAVIKLKTTSWLHTTNQTNCLKGIFLFPSQKKLSDFQKRPKSSICCVIRPPDPKLIRFQTWKYQ